MSRIEMVEELYRRYGDPQLNRQRRWRFLWKRYAWMFVIGGARLLKRGLDVTGSGLGLLALAPIFTLVALAIKLTDRGPVLFWQSRVGQWGREFPFPKFRSMVVNADKLQAVSDMTDDPTRGFRKAADDPRVTHMGRFIRRTSLDELPQFINVLKGDMSMVGPRPELPWLVDAYQPWQRKRFAVPQGLTGWWQINGRSDNPMHLNTDQDLYYIQNYSIWLDILILWRTIGVVLRGRGAY